MKKLVLALLATGLAFTARAQAIQPHKGDNVILIQTTDSATTALKKLGQAFVAQGYVVERYEPQFNSLILAPKTLSSTFAPTLSARASASPGANCTLRIFGESHALVLNRNFTYVAQIEGSEKGVPISSFRALEKVALTYPGGQVSYSKQ